VTAAAIAVVIFVGAAVSATRTPTPARSGPLKIVAPGDYEYKQALTALASGETTKAIDLLTKSAAAGNIGAKAKLEDIKRAAVTPPAPAKPITEDALRTRVADIASLLPTSVPGFTIGRAETDTLAASLSLGPRGQNPVKVRLALMTVFDKETEASAKAFVSDISKAYPKDLRNVTVGDYAGRFGTDGSHLASAVFSRGRYAFEVVMTASEGAPSALLPATLEVAGAFPAARKP
jgi:hypothetical protein